MIRKQISSIKINIGTKRSAKSPHLSEISSNPSLKSETNVGVTLDPTVDLMLDWSVHSFFDGCNDGFIGGWINRQYI